MVVSNSEGTKGCAIAFCVLSWLAVIGRFYTRATIVKTLSMDDWWTLATTIIFTAFCVTVHMVAYLVTETDITAFANLAKAARLLFSAFLIYIINALVLKISLMLFMLRILPNYAWQRRVLYLCTVAFSIVSVVYFFLTLFDCGNPELWLEHHLVNKCFDKDKVTLPVAYLHGAVNTITDWVFVGLPVTVVLTVQMPRRAKQIVAALLVLGGIGSICSAVRIGFIHLLDQDFQHLFTSAANIGTLSIIEIATGIIAPSLSTLRPLFKELKGSRADSAGKSGQSGKNADKPGSTKQSKARASSGGRESGFFTNGSAGPDQEKGLVYVKTETIMTRHEA